MEQSICLQRVNVQQYCKLNAALTGLQFALHFVFSQALPYKRQLVVGVRHTGDYVCANIL